MLLGVAILKFLIFLGTLAKSLFSTSGNALRCCFNGRVLLFSGYGKREIKMRSPCVHRDSFGQVRLHKIGIGPLPKIVPTHHDMAVEALPKGQNKSYGEHRRRVWMGYQCRAANRIGSDAS